MVHCRLLQRKSLQEIRMKAISLCQGAILFGNLAAGVVMGIFKWVLNYPFLSELSLTFLAESMPPIFSDIIEKLGESCKELSKIHSASDEITHSEVVALAAAKFRYYTIAPLRLNMQLTIPAAAIGIPTCLDTKNGAHLRFLCKSCILVSDSYTFTWAFEDWLDIQLFSTAIAFEVSASTLASKKHHSTLPAMLPVGQSCLLTTFPGSQWNVITLNFIPWVYKSKGIPRLFQIAFHSYTPGSSSASLKELEASYLELQGVKIALQIRVLSKRPCLVEADLSCKD